MDKVFIFQIAVIRQAVSDSIIQGHIRVLLYTVLKSDEVLNLAKKHSTIGSKVKFYYLDLSDFVCSNESRKNNAPFCSETQSAHSHKDYEQLKPELFQVNQCQFLSVDWSYFDKSNFLPSLLHRLLLKKHEGVADTPGNICK